MAAENSSRTRGKGLVTGLRALSRSSAVLAEPSASSTVMYRMEAGESVNVLGYVDAFAEIEADGMIGYIPEADMQGTRRPASTSGLEAPRQERIDEEEDTDSEESLSEYPGSRFVASSLDMVAWLTLIGGQLLALFFAASLECDSGDDCALVNGIRLSMYLGVTLASVVTALLLFAVAYGLRFLDEIEQNTRAGG